MGVLPHVTLLNFDPSSRSANPVSALKICELSFATHHFRPDLNLYLQKPSPSKIFVARAQRLILNGEFFLRAKMNSPVRIYCKPGPSTKRSFTAIITGTDKTDEAVLFHSVSSVVCLDRLTRKVIASVDSDPNSVLGNPLRVQVIPIPVRHFRWRMRVAHSDTDINRHFNQAAYCRYCMDAAASATHKIYLQHFKRDFYAHRVKQIDILYQGEAFTEDELEVCVWEDGNLANTLHFQILNGTKNVAFCTMLFHNSFSSNL